jgi:hypothetical protein
MTRPVSWRRFRLPLVAGVCLAALSAVALGVLPQEQGTVDLLTQANVTLSGAAATDVSGYSVAPAGDVNGDGLADLIVGAPYADPSSSRDAAGSSYVIYGKASPSDVDLASLGSSGFRIDGVATDDQAGTSVASAGDINGDGFADLIVGAPFADPSTRTDGGRSYVIYGRAAGSNLDLRSPGSAVRIVGAAARDHSGVSVASAGDVNGDGWTDLVVGAPDADPFSRTDAGSSYVIYGSASLADVDLRSLGVRGFRIDGAAAEDSSGRSVAPAGDINGDGYAEVIVGAPSADPPSRTNAGSSYVIYGKASPSNVDLALPLGSNGFRIEGAAAGDQSGSSVASAGDINGDGRTDVIVGAPWADPFSRTSAGSSYVLYGTASPSDVDLASPLGSSGFRIDGAADSTFSGDSVAAAGDINVDGRADVIVGAPLSDPSSRTNAGSSYVVYGTASPSNVDLASLGFSGFRIDGAAAGDSSGDSVAPAGDINGDGRADVIVGASGASPFSRTGAGSSYVIYGFRPASVSYPGAITATVGTPITSVTPTVRRTGAATFSVSPALPAGLSLDTATGVISGTPTEAATVTSTVTMTDLSGTATTTVSVTVTALPAPLPAAQPAAPAAQSAAPAAQPLALKGRMACTGNVCATSGTLPAGATGIVQSATAEGKKAARAKCSMKTTGKGTKAKRTFTCTLRVTKGTWTVTTSARAKNGTIVAQSVLTKRVK